MRSNEIDTNDHVNRKLASQWV